MCPHFNIDLQNQVVPRIRTDVKFSSFYPMGWILRRDGQILSCLYNHVTFMSHMSPTFQRGGRSDSLSTYIRTHIDVYPLVRNICICMQGVVGTMRFNYANLTCTSQTEMYTHLDDLILRWSPDLSSSCRNSAAFWKINSTPLFRLFSKSTHTSF